MIFEGHNMSMKKVRFFCSEAKITVSLHHI
jgi:hypothetical protein